MRSARGRQPETPDCDTNGRSGVCATPRRSRKSTVHWGYRSDGPRVLNVRSLRRFLGRLSRHLEAAGFRCGYFDVTLTNDRETARLNREFRHRDGAADVLSFPWRDHADSQVEDAALPGELADFLGDIVISLESAARTAATEKHSLQTEVEQLTLHGALHLLGCDHETDHGEMDALELKLRQALDIEGLTRAVARRRRA